MDSYVTAWIANGVLYMQVFLVVMASWVSLCPLLSNIHVPLSSAASGPHLLQLYYYSCLPTMLITWKDTRHVPSTWGAKANVCHVSTSMFILAIFNAIKASAWLSLCAALWRKEAYICSNKTPETSLFEQPHSYVILDIWFECAGHFSSSAMGEEEREGAKKLREGKCIYRCWGLILTQTHL